MSSNGIFTDESATSILGTNDNSASINVTDNSVQIDQGQEVTTTIENIVDASSSAVTVNEVLNITSQDEEVYSIELLDEIIQIASLEEEAISVILADNLLIKKLSEADILRLIELFELKSAANAKYTFILSELNKILSGRITQEEFDILNSIYVNKVEYEQRILQLQVDIENSKTKWQLTDW